MHERGPKRTYRPDMTPPTLHGEHPPGIAGPHLAHGVIGAFDAPARDWPDLAERLMRQGGMTVTIGFGADALHARRRPSACKPLPAVRRRRPRPARCGGAACVLICSDEPTDALTRFGDPVWTRRGRRTPDGALGFRDGTMNPRRPLDLDAHVWVSDARPDEMVGGTYLVVRDIEVDATWQAPRRGRPGTHHRPRQAHGAPLGGTPPVREAAPRDAARGRAHPPGRHRAPAA